MIRNFLISIILLAAAAPAFAGVVITEIMYDLDGLSDTGREWIEIQNNGSSQIDLAGWKLFEANTNHGITAAGSQTFVLPAGAYAVIADNVEKFLADWPSFSGTFFDSLFSLSNTGEALALRNSELADSDAVTYSSDWGAQGDGKSLQKIGGGWVAALPTPGFGPVGEEPTQQTAGSSGGEVSNTGVGVPLEMSESVSKIKAGAGADRTVLAGAEVVFEGSADGFTDATADKIRFHWNFGNGKTGEGNKVAHVFSFPGTYEVFLTVSFAGVSASDSVKITAVENPVVVSEIKYGKFIEIYNASPRKIDFSKFGLSFAGAQPFYFPDGTFLVPWAYLALEHELFGFEIPQSGEIKILYPNGKILLSSVYQLLVLGEKESLSLVDGRWQKSKVTPGAKNEVVKISSALPVSTGNRTQAKLEPPVAGAGEKVVEEINLASVSSQTSNFSYLFNSEYIWLLAGLCAGIFGGLALFFAKRYWA